jgi:hypothetical protein
MYQDGNFIGESETIIKFNKEYKIQEHFYIGVGNPTRELIPNWFYGSFEYFAYYDTKLKRVAKFLCDKAIKNDTVDRPPKEYIQFYPFIEMCNNSSELKKIITNPHVINLNYIFFMYDIGIHTDCRIQICLGMLFFNSFD